VADGRIEVPAMTALLAAHGEAFPGATMRTTTFGMCLVLAGG
jgi:hypothetical protein